MCADGIAASVTISVLSYVLLGFQFQTDGLFMHSFEIWIATTVVFFGSGNVGYTLLEYRLGAKQLVSCIVFCQRRLTAGGFQVKGFLENMMWIPFL
jgi:hypothetical protein